MTKCSHERLLNIANSYYDAVDSRDIERLARQYLPTPHTTLQFNSEPAIVTVEKIKEFSSHFFQVAETIKHSMIEVWTNPLNGDVVPMDLPAPRSCLTTTVISTAYPTFSIRGSIGMTTVSLPATSLFTIDIESEKLVSVHNMFDLGKIYAVVEASS